MLRQDVHPRTSFAAAAPRDARSARAWRSAAAAAATLLRVIAVPIALLAAAAGGLVFAVLLPICGIATIAEGVAKASWRFVRDTMPHALHLPARRI